MIILHLKRDGIVVPRTMVWPESGSIGLRPMPSGTNQILVTTNDKQVILDKNLNVIYEKWIGNNLRNSIITKNGEVYLATTELAEEEKTKIMRYKPGSNVEMELIEELTSSCYLYGGSPDENSLLLKTKIRNADGTSEFVVLDVHTLNVKKRISANLDAYTEFDLHGKYRLWTANGLKYADFDWETMTFVPIDLPGLEMKYFPKFGGFATAKYDQMGSLQFTKYP